VSDLYTNISKREIALPCWYYCMSYSVLTPLIGILEKVVLQDSKTAPAGTNAI
jgi:hypothetical protein